MYDIIENFDYFENFIVDIVITYWLYLLLIFKVYTTLPIEGSNQIDGNIIQIVLDVFILLVPMNSNSAEDDY